MERTERVIKRAHLASYAALTALCLLCGGGQALAKENPQTGMAEVNAQDSTTRRRVKGQQSSSSTAGWLTAVSGTTR